MRRAIRIVILGINYDPEVTGIAPYTTGLATSLAQRGHDVAVLTGFPHYPQWQRDASTSGFRSAGLLDGVRVHRFSHHVPTRMSWLGRVAMELTFGMQVVTSRWKCPDVIVCVTPPLLAAAMAVARTRLSLRRPAVGIIVQDLYGRGVVESGAGSHLVGRMMSAVESATFRLCDGVSVIHAGFGTDLTTHLGVDARRVREIRNWTHVASPDPLASRKFRDEHHWGDDLTVVLHAGNMGYKQGLENVVAAARLADRDDLPVRFVLLGDGNQRTALKSAGAGVRALEFLPPVSNEEFPAALGAADVLLVNERPGVSQMAVPSKLTSYFSAGKPILAASEADGYTAGEVAASGAGICVPPGRPDLLLSEASRLGGDHDLAERLAASGRRYCENRLSERSALDRYEQWVLDLARTRTGRPRSRVS